MIICPGGLENGGGIGRQMGYFLSALPEGATNIAYKVVDSRGPWYIGNSPWRTLFSVFYLVVATAEIILARFRTGPALAHINITGRGSTIRKIVLVAAARVAGIPYLLHVHDYDYAADYNRRGPAMKFLVRGIFGAAHKVLVLGATARETLIAALRLAPDRISIWHNAVPDPRATGQPVAATDAPPAKDKVSCGLLFLGHLSARKGVPELLTALASPALQKLPWHATIAGGGPVAEYQRMAVELGIRGKITFPGWVDEDAVRDLCSRSSILALPSHAEGLAMSLLEGLAHGLATVVTPVGAHPEVIADGISGLFVTPGDTHGLASTLKRVLEDGALRQALQQGARHRFLQGFEISSYARRLVGLHESILFGSEIGEPLYCADDGYKN